MNEKLDIQCNSSTRDHSAIILMRNMLVCAYWGSWQLRLTIKYAIVQHHAIPHAKGQISLHPFSRLFRKISQTLSSSIRSSVIKLFRDKQTLLCFYLYRYINATVAILFHPIY